MKKIMPILILLLFIQSCATTTIFRDKIDLTQLLKARDNIESTDNIAKQMLLKNELSNKIVVLNKIKVKDIIPSSNVDYEFCILSDVKSDKGDIELYIYSKNIRALSRMKAGESYIEVEGEFTRFFSTLDDYFLKIELVNSRLRILEPDNTSEE
jgi:hypothetical protein